MLVLHGFTGSPHSMRPLAEALANRGYAVEAPRLPGHGTSVDDLAVARWEDWRGAATAALAGLQATCRRVGIVGQSVGGGLAAWLAATTPEVVAIVLVNPMVHPVAPELQAGLGELLDSGVEMIDGVVNDIAKPGADEIGYDKLPLRAAASLMEGLAEVAGVLGSITCPTLVLSSRQDHVVTSDNSALVVDSVAGPVEQIWLERSFHVATLDFDAPRIEDEACRFFAVAFEDS